MINIRYCRECGNAYDSIECPYCREKKEREKDGTK